MGGLFGGGSSGSSNKYRMEPSPAVDMSGAKSPGDDKIAARKSAMVADAATAKADKTLLGRSAPAAAPASATPAPAQPTYR
jgi:hypothetical protein